MKSLTIIGRRWFRRTYGNTYNTTEVLIDGKPAFKTAKQYGYGDHFRDIAMDELERRGLLPVPREHYKHGGAESDWRYCERNGIQFSYSVTDVARERDL